MSDEIDTPSSPRRPRWRQALIGGGLVFGGVALGALLFGGGGERSSTGGHAEHQGASDETIEWTCSMHPQIRLPEAGQCPICFMDLIPAKTGSNDRPATELELSPAAKALAEVRTARVERGEAVRELALVGRVTYDETLVQRVSSFVPGRIERLYVEVTGTPVKKGEHLLRIYSPELLAAQTEWLDASKQARLMPAGSAARSILDRTAASAEERLRLWGLSRRQLDQIRGGGEPQERITVYAPRGGVVVEREAIVGAYVKEGTPLYTLADLSRLWVQLDAYEQDLPHVRFGQEVVLSTDAMPGAQFRGRVSFVAPVVDERSRTVRVRVTFDNTDGTLKPGMMVRGLLRAPVDEHGHAVSVEGLDDAWVCPMHPDVVRDAAGRCDVCGMRLQSAAGLGLVHTEPHVAPLLIPASAPLLTGKRAVVYVEVPGRERPTYEGRIVDLGPRVGDRYVVVRGLQEGELVVVQGAFKLDAAMQVQAKPSMMSPHAAHGDEPASGPMEVPPGAEASEPTPFRPGQSQAKQTGAAAASGRQARTPTGATSSGASTGAKAWPGVIKAYLDVERALTADDFASASAAAQRLQAAAAELKSAAARSGPIKSGAAALSATKEIAAARTAFAPLSQSIIDAARAGSAKPATALHVFFCPMALKGKGAQWVQTAPELSNPYFGAKMLRCGESRGTIPAKDAP